MAIHAAIRLYLQMKIAVSRSTAKSLRLRYGSYFLVASLTSLGDDVGPTS